MLQVPAFREDDSNEQLRFIQAHPLGLLITSDQTGPQANLIPFVVKADEAKLEAHVSRANPLLGQLERNASILAVFQGAESYISPSLYESKKTTPKVVPTWNYSMVQVRGEVTLHTDPDRLRSHLEELTQSQESQRLNAWQVSDAPENFIFSQIKGIVGIEISISQMQGKMKMSQNRPDVDRDSVAKGLQDTKPAVADMVRAASRRKRNKS